MIKKDLVKERFERSFADYDKNAIAQKLIADKMFEILVSKCGESFEKIFEIGCGSGILTNKLTALKHSELILNDISEIASQYNASYAFLFGDAEVVDYPAQLDLIASSSTVQWFTDFENFLKKAYTSLNVGGYLVFTTFLDKNFTQIKDVFGFSLDYFKDEELKTIVKKDFELVYFEEEILTFYFKDLFDLLRHIKYTGTNALAKIKLTRGLIDAYSNKYQKHASRKGFPLTYNPAYVVLKKVR